MPGFASVGLDGAQGARLAVEHLVGVHGHRRIGIALGDAAHDLEDPREIGWREALRAAGLPEGPVARVPWTRDGGYEAGRLLLDSPDPPTAVFACSDLLAVGLLRAGHERGLALPGDLAVVSFDGTKEAEYSWPPLTVVAQPIAAMAREAVSLALDPARPTPYHAVPGDARRPALLRLPGRMTPARGARRPAVVVAALVAVAGAPRRRRSAAALGVRAALDRRAYVSDLRLDAALETFRPVERSGPGLAGRPAPASVPTAARGPTRPPAPR